MKMSSNVKGVGFLIIGDADHFPPKYRRQMDGRRLLCPGNLNSAGSPIITDAVSANLIEWSALDFTNLSCKLHRLRHGGYPSLDGEPKKLQ